MWRVTRRRWSPGARRCYEAHRSRGATHHLVRQGSPVIAERGSSTLIAGVLSQEPIVTRISAAQPHAVTSAGSHSDSVAGDDDGASAATLVTARRRTVRGAGQHRHRSSPRRRYVA